MFVPDRKRYLLIIDLEATCCNRGSIPNNETEIIEIGAVKTDLDYNIIDELSVIVKPTRHSILTRFCTELTTITQEMVDDGVLLREALDKVKELWDYNTLFCSWGYYDRNQLQRECKRKGIDYPFDEKHLNIKVGVADRIGLSSSREGSLGNVMRILGMTFEGTPHRGICDARNMVSVLKKVYLK